MENMLLQFTFCFIGCLTSAVCQADKKNKLGIFHHFDKICKVSLALFRELLGDVCTVISFNDSLFSYLTSFSHLQRGALLPQHFIYIYISLVNELLNKSIKTVSFALSFFCRQCPGCSDQGLGSQEK